MLGYAIFWFVILIAAIIVEAVTYQLVAVWFGGGAVASIVAAALGATLLVQIVVFVVISAVLIVSTRPFAKRVLNTHKVGTNADRLIGKDAVVIQTIQNQVGKGQANAMGQIWTARSVNGEDIAEGETVEVDHIEGVKLMVRKK